MSIPNDELEQRISALGQTFTKRLDSELLACSIDYARFNECALAIEMLCDHLFEHAVVLTEAEFQKLRDLASETGADLERIELLKSLIRGEPIQTRPFLTET